MCFIDSVIYITNCNYSGHQFVTTIIPLIRFSKTYTHVDLISVNRVYARFSIKIFILEIWICNAQCVVCLIIGKFYFDSTFFLFLVVLIFT